MSPDRSGLDSSSGVAVAGDVGTGIENVAGITGFGQFAGDDGAGESCTHDAEIPHLCLPLFIVASLSLS